MLLDCMEEGYFHVGDTRELLVMIFLTFFHSDSSERRFFHINNVLFTPLRRCFKLNNAVYMPILVQIHC